MIEHNENFYTNGSTHPPKSRGGVLALVLCCLILVSSIVSLLKALTDICLTQTEDQQVLFLCSTEPSTQSVIPIDPENPPALPLTGEWVTQFDQEFRSYPAGLYVTDVPEGDAIEPGDILLSVNGNRIKCCEELNAVLFAHRAGDRVELMLYRDGQHFTVTVTLKEVRD